MNYKFKFTVGNRVFARHSDVPGIPGEVIGICREAVPHYYEVMLDGYGLAQLNEYHLELDVLGELARVTK